MQKTWKVMAVCKEIVRNAIYLIDRSNKDLTCFPAIPTMAEQLHISVSTVKRALHELVDTGFIKKTVLFSNLYTLVQPENAPTPGPDDAPAVEPAPESAAPVDGASQPFGEVVHITFDTLKSENRKKPADKKPRKAPARATAVTRTRAMSTPVQAVPWLHQHPYSTNENAGLLRSCISFAHMGFNLQPS